MDQALQKLRWSLPWLLRYPFWRSYERLRRPFELPQKTHLIILVANHFEPAWTDGPTPLSWSEQMRRVDDWGEKVRALSVVRDYDGKPFTHTNFYPAEQYYEPLVQQLADQQADGLGEVEIHLHHGVNRPDTAENLRRTLTDFRDCLAERHRCLSTESGSTTPRYGFVHGNLALANSAGGRLCGVDSEMQILAETGCYADFTLPAAPNQSQVPRVNAIYRCGLRLDRAVPHRSGPTVRSGGEIQLPLIFTGPLVFNWRRKVGPFPFPRLEEGVLADNYPLNLDRLQRWRSARIGVLGRGEWIFIKLTCHGFISKDQPQMIGEPIRRFLEEAIEFGERTGEFTIHFASAREAFNMVLAAIDGHSGLPGDFRNYRLRPIMEKVSQTPTRQFDAMETPVMINS